MLTASSGVEGDSCGVRWLGYVLRRSDMFDTLAGEDCSDGTLFCSTVNYDEKAERVCWNLGRALILCPLRTGTQASASSDMPSNALRAQHKSINSPWFSKHPLMHIHTHIPTPDSLTASRPPSLPSRSQKHSIPPG